MSHRTAAGPKLTAAGKLRSVVSDEIATGLDRADDAWRKGKAVLSDGAVHAGAESRAALGGASDALTELGERVARELAARPGRTLGLAFAAGALLGLIAAPRRRP